MYTLLIIIEILVCVLLIIAVLLQNSKGGGLAAGLGGGNIGAVFGARRASDFLSKSTWTLAITFFVLALVINIFFLPSQGASVKESIIQSGQTSVPPAQIPQQQPATK